MGISMANVLSHLRLVHASDPNFSVPCGVEGCYTMFKSFPSSYQHIYRKHRDAGIIQARKEVHQNEASAELSSPMLHIVEPIPGGRNNC